MLLLLQYAAVPTWPLPQTTPTNSTGHFPHFLREGLKKTQQEKAIEPRFGRREPEDPKCVMTIHKSGPQTSDHLPELWLDRLIEKTCMPSRRASFDAKEALFRNRLFYSTAYSCHPLRDHPRSTTGAIPRALRPEINLPLESVVIGNVRSTSAAQKGHSFLYNVLNPSQAIIPASTSSPSARDHCQKDWRLRLIK